MRISDWSSDVCSSDLRRNGYVVEQVQWLPADLADLLDRLCGEFRRGDVEEDVGAGGFQVDDLRVDGGVGGFIGKFRDDHRLGLVAEPVLQAFDIVLTVIVVLEQDRDFRVGLVFLEILRSEEHTSELQSLMRNSYAVFCLKKKKKTKSEDTTH